MKIFIVKKTKTRPSKFSSTTYETCLRQGVSYTDDISATSTPIWNLILLSKNGSGVLGM